MLQVILQVPQAVTIDDAKARMEKLLPRIQSENPNINITDIVIHWNAYHADFSFTAKGNAITGRMDVGHNQIIINGTLPFFASFFKGTIEQTIADNGNALLA